MKKSRIRNGLVAAGISAALALGVVKYCGDHPLTSNDPEVAGHTDSPNLENGKNKKKHTPAKKITPPPEIKKVLDEINLEKKIYNFGVNACTGDGRLFDTVYIMELNEDYDQAMRTLEDAGYYLRAGEIAVKSGDLALAKDEFLMAAEDGDAYYAAEGLAEIGEYDLAMNIYTDMGATANSISLALEYGEEATARKLFENLHWENAKMDDPYWLNASFMNRFGYWDEYVKRCSEMPPEIFCHDEILRVEGETDPLKMVAYEVEMGRNASALLVARRHGLYLPELEEKVKHEIIERSSAGYTPWYIDMGMEEIQELGYGDLAWEALSAHVHEEIRLGAPSQNYSFVDLGKTLGRFDEVFDYYDELIAHSNHPNFYLSAALDAMKMGIRDREKHYWSGYLEHTAFMIPEDGYYPYANKFIILGLVRSGRLEEAYGLCRKFPSTSAQCNCAYDLMLAMKPEKHNWFF